MRPAHSPLRRFERRFQIRQIDVPVDVLLFGRARRMALMMQLWLSSSLMTAVSAVISDGSTPMLSHRPS